MKTILVPTDFSANADNALNYAIELAKIENAKLILLHAFETNYESGAVSYNLIAEEKASLEIQSNKRLQTIGYKIELSSKLKYECISVEGFVIDVILNLIEEQEIDLVVMGTKGASGLSGVIFGSNTTKVIEKAKCPVIAVPEGAIYMGFGKITYATDYHENDIQCLKKVIEIAEPLNAQVNILHISINPHSEEIERETMKTFMDEINHKITYSNLSFQLINGASINASLEEYLESNATSLMVMSTHRRDFFDKIFGSSITKHIAYKIKTPLMVFHYNAKREIKVF